MFPDHSYVYKIVNTFMNDSILNRFHTTYVVSKATTSPMKFPKSHLFVNKLCIHKSQQCLHGNSSGLIVAGSLQGWGWGAALATGLRFTGGKERPKKEAKPLGLVGGRYNEQGGLGRGLSWEAVRPADSCTSPPES